MKKPKITLLVDYPNWAFDHSARSVVRRLKHKFDFEIKYVALRDKLDSSQTDLLHVFFWGETYYKQFNFRDEQIIKEVTSLRWKYEKAFGFLSSEDFARKYLADCSCVVTPAISIFNMLDGHVDELFHVPNGVEIGFFTPPSQMRRSPHLTIGWVGNPDDSTKGLADILIPASTGHKFCYTDGRMSHYKLSRFYKEIDILAIASIAEGEPLPLLESMASGCFPVVTNVGLVPELIVDKHNGLIVERNVGAFREAFKWCAANLAMVRELGRNNRVIVRGRSWDRCVARFDEIYTYAYNKKIMQANGKISATFDFDSVTNNASVKPEDYRSSVSLKLSNLMLIIVETWSRFWMGDRYAPGYWIWVRNSVVRRIQHRLINLMQRFLGSRADSP